MKPKNNDKNARNKGALSKDDKILWSRVARSTTPLPNQMSNQAIFEQFLEDNPTTEQSPKPLVTKGAFALKPISPKAPTPRSNTPQPHIDKPTRRKITKGRIGIDGRIDLHDMNQAQAHDALLTFLQRQYWRGHRHVLVITGKGSSLDGRGVIKRSLPHWLEHPSFRNLVSGYQLASRTHGGEGAYYIRLKKQTSPANKEFGA